MEPAFTPAYTNLDFIALDRKFQPYFLFSYSPLEGCNTTTYNQT